MFETHLTPCSLLLSCHLILLSAAFTPVITPSYYLPIMLYYGLQSSTMVLTSCQVRAGTLKHTPKYTRILSPTLSHNLSRAFSFLSWYVLILSPSSSCLVQAKAHPPVQPCIIQQQPLSIFFPLYHFLKSQLHISFSFLCFIISSSLRDPVSQPMFLAWPLPPALQPHLCLQTFRPWSGLPAVFQPSTPSVLQYQHQGSALSISSHNHTTQFKQVFRLGPVYVCVCVSLPSPKHRWTYRERCQILLVLEEGGVLAEAGGCSSFCFVVS